MIQKNENVILGNMNPRSSILIDSNYILRIFKGVIWYRFLGWVKIILFRLLLESRRKTHLWLMCSDFSYYFGPDFESFFLIHSNFELLIALEMLKDEYFRCHFLLFWPFLESVKQISCDCSDFSSYFGSFFRFTVWHFPSASVFF